jgi:Amt family ammonium transporter
VINSGDTAFLLISAAFVWFMTPGLAFFYGGLVRKKNILAIMMQSFVSIGVVTVIWYTVGFSLVFGPDIHGLIGNLQYAFLNGVGFAPNPTYAPTVPFLVFFCFQLMFAIITPALITGAFADRVTFKSYLIFLIVWSFLVYIPAAHWIWGGGFLAKMGVVDFAGGLVVHETAGIAALTSVFVVGKRIIHPSEDLRPHNIPFVALGTAMLWFGWFGFNAGSALAANGVAAFAFANTNIAASVAMVAWFLLAWAIEKRPSFVAALTGAVAGLATITPAAGYVQPWGAILIGICATAFCYLAVAIKNKFKWDDALDVWGVHGVGGIVGTICLGLFASSAINGISGLWMGNYHQFLVQVFAVLLLGVYAFVVTYISLKVINVFTPVRVGEREEIEGLDLWLHGEAAYLLDGGMVMAVTAEADPLYASGDSRAV